MRDHHIHICLFQPEIPQNAGSIGRLAAATHCRLHMIRPFGFSTSDRNLRRAGLDYWPFLDLEIHDSLDELLERFSGRFAFFSKFAAKTYDTMPDTTELLIFGQETKGLPPWVHAKYARQLFGIPLFHQGVRSINLANAVAITTYHQLARRGCFAGALTPPSYPIMANKGPE